MNLLNKERFYDRIRELTLARKIFIITGKTTDVSKALRMFRETRKDFKTPLWLSTKQHGRGYSKKIINQARIQEEKPEECPECKQLTLYYLAPCCGAPEGYKWCSGCGFEDLMERKE